MGASDASGVAVGTGSRPNEQGGSTPTQEERDLAIAVRSVDDETRVHAGGDETSLVMNAGGELEQSPNAGAEADENVDAVHYMADEVADDGGETRAEDYVISYAVEEAEGMYDWLDGELVRQNPEETNTHLEVAVRDASDGRLVPGARVTVTMIGPDGTEVGTEHHPLLWHPMVYHYGRNWKLPVDGEYVMRVHVDRPRSCDTTRSTAAGSSPQWMSSSVMSACVVDHRDVGAGAYGCRPSRHTGLRPPDRWSGPEIAAWRRTGAEQPRSSSVRPSACRHEDSAPAARR